MDPTQQAFLELFENSTQVSDLLLDKYNLSGPRYTSYPTAPVWTEEDHDGHWFKTTVLGEALPQQEDSRSLSIYVHLPFCESRCLFCSCNVVITRQKEQAERYLGYLFKEIDMVAAQVTKKRQVVQIHWGGGTPTYMDSDQLQRVFEKLASCFTIDKEAEISLEVDPRVTSFEQLERLRTLGFNRVSMGVQDFDPKVQETIKRLQSYELTKALVDKARSLGYGGVNIDLIYGLPFQSLDRFRETVEQILQLRPDRLALYNYAHVPWISPWQKTMPEEAMPGPDAKFDIFRMAIAAFLRAGYHYIGMDHFALPDDELAVAFREGTLHRNFMGYTTRAGEAEMLAFGVSAISGLEGHYSQNLKKLSTYYQAIEEDQLPTWRGYELNQDDQIRRKVIQQLMCLGYLEFQAIESEYDIEFYTYFAEEVERLKVMESDGLIVIEASKSMQLTALGRILARNIAMVFDVYLKKKSPEKPLFSKTL